MPFLHFFAGTTALQREVRRFKGMAVSTLTAIGGPHRPPDIVGHLPSMFLEFFDRVDFTDKHAPDFAARLNLRISFGVHSCGTWQSERIARTPDAF